METSEILKKLERAVPGAVLEQGSLGLARTGLFRINAHLLREVASFLNKDAAIALNWLDNLSVYQEGDVLWASYFLRSVVHAHTLILRVSVSLNSSVREVDLPSLCSVWRMAEPFEVELGELFGIRFTDTSGERFHRPFQRLPKDWSGYPLRKRYVFPTEFLGITHSRKDGAGAR